MVGAVALAGIPAKQYAQGGKLITVAIDSGVIYLIEGPASPSQGGPKDGGEWEEVQNLIVSSFALTEKAAASGATDENVIYEEEEVIE